MIKINLTTDKELNIKKKMTPVAKISGDINNISFEMTYIIFDVFYRTLLNTDKDKKTNFAKMYLDNIKRIIKDLEH